MISMQTSTQLSMKVRMPLAAKMQHIAAKTGC